MLDGSDLVAQRLHLCLGGSRIGLLRRPAIRRACVDERGLVIDHSQASVAKGGGRLCLVDARVVTATDDRSAAGDRAQRDECTGSGGQHHEQSCRHAEELTLPFDARTAPRPAYTNV